MTFDILSINLTIHEIVNTFLSINLFIKITENIITNLFVIILLSEHILTIFDLTFCNTLSRCSSNILIILNQFLIFEYIDVNVEISI